MNFTHDEYVAAILELEAEFSRGFTSAEYTEAMFQLEKEFVLVIAPT